MKAGILYLVATPIGNLEEITARALDTLRTVDFIYAEDTRISYKLLSHYQIKTPLRALFYPKMVVKKDEILALLEKGARLALITDAGTPVISDPGYEITSILPNKIKVIPVGCPNAAISALIASKLPPSPFLFLGFLPHRGSQKTLLKYRDYIGTIILYEAPHRLITTLNLLFSLFGNLKCALARELSKVYEEIITTDLKSLLNSSLTPKGEYVIVLCKENIVQVTLNELCEYYLAQGYTKKEIIKKVIATTDFKHSEVYNYLLKEKNQDEK